MHRASGRIAVVLIWVMMGWLSVSYHLHAGGNGTSVLYGDGSPAAAGQWMTANHDCLICGFGRTAAKSMLPFLAIPDAAVLASHLAPVSRVAQAHRVTFDPFLGRAPPTLLLSC